MDHCSPAPQRGAGSPSEPQNGACFFPGPQNGAGSPPQHPNAGSVGSGSPQHPKMRASSFPGPQNLAGSFPGPQCRVWLSPAPQNRGWLLSRTPKWGWFSPSTASAPPHRAASTAHLHLEEDVVPAGLVELVGVEEEGEDVVGVGAVFGQSLGVLFGVAGRQLGWGMFGDEGELLTGNFYAETCAA